MFGSSPINSLWMLSLIFSFWSVADEWSKFTPDNYRQQIPDKRDGQRVEIHQLSTYYSFNSANYYELMSTLRHGGDPHSGEVIYLGRGHFDLKQIATKLERPDILSEVSPGVFFLRRPMYLSPMTTLVLQDVELRLSIPDVAFIAYRGELFVDSSLITSWDPERRDWGPRKQYEKKDVLKFRVGQARPYLLGMRGSKSIMISSKIYGLGYQGQSSSFGLALSTRVHGRENDPLSLYHFWEALPEPTGVFVGNWIEQCFFGFFTNRANRVSLVGNVFKDNVVYNFDPHDFSNHLLIARNIAVGAKFSHGFIISREVDHSRLIENMSLANAGAGIMLDRNSRHTQVYRNLSFANGHDGISVLESDQNDIQNNISFGNGNNGILIRNSAGIHVRNNMLWRNGRFGLEASTQDLSHHSHRDLKLDPYRQITRLEVKYNRIGYNLGAALTSKGHVQIFLQENDYSGSGSAFFGGDLGALKSDILEQKTNEGLWFCPGSKVCLEASSSSSP